MTILENITYKIKTTGSNLFFLIGINILVFFIGLLFPAINNYLLLPPDTSTLAIKAWTPITYMFVNTGLLALIFNMLWFYWTATIFENLLGYKRLLGLYLLGGISGAALYILSYYVLTGTNVASLVNTGAAGAMACVLTIMVSAATLAPDAELNLIIIGRVKIKWLVAIYIVFDLVTINSLNAGEKISHIGGALFGFIYIKRLQAGTDWIGNINNLFKPKPKMKVVVNNTPEKKSASGYPRQEEIDRILDKISQSGYDSLNRQEKEVLFRASKDEG